MDSTGGSLQVFVHVPKCGGRTVQSHLARHLGTRFWSVDKRFRYLSSEPFGRKFDRTSTCPLGDIRAVSGHFLGRSVESLFPDRSIVRTMILREPQRQVLSWYNFRMMRYITAGQSPYSFRLFLRSMRVDPVAHFLLERWLELPWVRIATLSATDKQQMLDLTLEQFDSVADISKTDQMIARHSAALGIPQQAARMNDSRQLAQRTGWRLLGLADLSERERKELDRNLYLDHYLWRKWALKQDVMFEPKSAPSFVRKEASRIAPQVWRRVVRSRALGETVKRIQLAHKAREGTARGAAALLPDVEQRVDPGAAKSSDGYRRGEEGSCQ